MRIGLVIDATCDLPDEFIRENDIRILPIHIRLGPDRLVDRRDPEATLHFYANHLDDGNVDAETVPYTAEEIRTEFLQRIVLDFDFAFVLTVTSTRSPIFENAQKASFAILNDYKKVRAEHGASGLFSMRVIDSRSLFSGTAVLAAEAMRQIKAGAAPNEIRTNIEALREHLSAYLVPADLNYIRTRAKKKGEKSIGLLTYAIGSALDIKPVLHAYQGETRPVAKIRHYESAVEQLLGYASRRIAEGLHAPFVCLSYGGDPAHIARLPGYDQLAATARQHGVQVLTSIMSATAAVNAGAGALALALAADPKPFRD